MKTEQKTRSLKLEGTCWKGMQSVCKDASWKTIICEVLVCFYLLIETDNCLTLLKYRNQNQSSRNLHLHSHYITSDTVIKVLRQICKCILTCWMINQPVLRTVSHHTWFQLEPHLKRSSQLINYCDISLGVLEGWVWSSRIMFRIYVDVNPKFIYSLCAGSS